MGACRAGAAPACIPSSACAAPRAGRPSGRPRPRPSSGRASPASTGFSSFSSPRPRPRRRVAAAPRPARRCRRGTAPRHRRRSRAHSAQPGRPRNLGGGAGRTGALGVGPRHSRAPGAGTAGGPGRPGRAREDDRSPPLARGPHWPGTREPECGRSVSSGAVEDEPGVRGRGSGVPSVASRSPRRWETKEGQRPVI